MHGVLGLHRHVVRLVELGDGRPAHVLRRQGAARPPRPARVPPAARPRRGPPADGHRRRRRHRAHRRPRRPADHPPPRLLAAVPHAAVRAGLSIPYLGDRLLDALVGLLVRLHLAGFFWGDCSLSNTLFRRDAGALQAYIIDVETSERYDTLTDGQRQMDLDIATENVAGGLLDLQVGGRLVERHRPVGDRHQPRVAATQTCGTSSPAIEEFGCREMWRIEQRLRRLHDLGFDVGEMEVIADEEGQRLRFVPRVVESGYHQDRLFALTGLWAGREPGPPAARRHPRLRRRAAGAHRHVAAGEHRRRALVRPALRADHRRRSRRR